MNLLASLKYQNIINKNKKYKKYKKIKNKKKI